MFTNENREEIKKIAKEHYDTIDILKVDNINMEEKAKAIHKELPSIYQKLKDKNLLPESINFDAFIKITTLSLQNEFQAAQFASFFRV